jgi:hypothetical protein
MGKQGWGHRNILHPVSHGDLLNLPVTMFSWMLIIKINNYLIKILLIVQIYSL